MRKSACVVLGAVIFLATSGFGQSKPDWTKANIEVKKLTENVYMLRFTDGTSANYGGNVGVFVGDDALVLGDDGYAPMAPRLEAAIKMLSDKPIKYILNTHWHVDHSQSNEYFGKFATIIATDNARAKMAKGNERNAPDPPVALPAITFSDQITLHMKDGDIREIHFPRGHTDTDATIFYPGGHVVQMGDDFTVWDPPHFPAIDMDRDGSGGVQGQIAAAEYVLSHVPEDVQIIPGHGPLSKREDLEKALAVLKGTAAAVQAGIDQGKSLEQLKQEKVLAQWDYLGQGRAQDDYLGRVYRCLTQKPPSEASGGGS